MTDTHDETPNLPHIACLYTRLSFHIMNCDASVPLPGALQEALFHERELVRLSDIPAEQPYCPRHRNKDKTKRIFLTQVMKERWVEKRHKALHTILEAYGRSLKKGTPQQESDTSIQVQAAV